MHEFFKRLTAMVILAVLAATGLRASETAITDPVLIDRLQKLSSDSLMTLGREYGYEKHQVQDALACFTIVADRCDAARMTEAQQLQCVEALNMQYEIYNMSLFDYSRSYDCLLQATEIMHRLGRENSHLQQNYGTFYQQSYTNTGETEYLERAVDCYKRAFAVALREKDSDRLNTVFPNLVSMASATGRIDSIGAEAKAYEAMKNDDDVFRRFNVLLYKGVSAVAHGNEAEAFDAFNTQLATVPDTKLRVRLRSMAFLQLGRLYQARGDRGQALAMADSVIAAGRRYGLAPVVISALREKSLIYGNAGDSRLAEQAELRYYAAKDSLMSERISNNVRSVTLLDKLSSAGVELREMSRQKETFFRLMMIVAAALVVVTAFVALMVYKNRQLRRVNKELYLKNTQLLRAEQALKEVPEQESGEKTADDDNPQLRDLWKRIQATIYSTDEIFNPDFSIARLAEMTDSNTSYVSAAINRFYGAGFPALIGDFRIKEACRRIQDFEHYGNLTLDNIALSVGIRSRTTFSNTFKRVVGMTPSEYLRQAKSD